MKIRRDFNSIPARSASETWKAITELVTGSDSKHRADLTAVAGVLGSIITDEHPSIEPFIFSGVGSRLVIYCQYGTDAVSGDENVTALNWNPTAGDWRLRVPCDQENLDWVSEALAKKTARVTAYDVMAPEPDEDSGQPESSAAKTIEIDWTAGGAR